MAELHSIEGRTRPAEINAGVVKIFEECLELARAGEITSAAVTLICADTDVRTITSPTDDLFKLIGAVSQLHFNMLYANRDD